MFCQWTHIKILSLYNALIIEEGIHCSCSLLLPPPRLLLLLIILLFSLLLSCSCSYPAPAPDPAPPSFHALASTPTQTVALPYLDLSSQEHKMYNIASSTNKDQFQTVLHKSDWQMRSLGHWGGRVTYWIGWFSYIFIYFPFLSNSSNYMAEHWPLIVHEWKPFIYEARESSLDFAGIWQPVLCKIVDLWSLFCDGPLQLVNLKLYILQFLQYMECHKQFLYKGIC